VDLFTATFGYDSDLVVGVTWSYRGALPGRPAIQVKGCVGTAGTVEYGDMELGGTGVLLDGEPVPNEDTEVNQFDAMLGEFHAAITQKREAETSARRCRVVIEMIEAVLESCETHEVVPITGVGAVRY